MRTLRSGLIMGCCFGALSVQASRAADSEACDDLMDALRRLTTGSFEEQWALLDEELPGIGKLSDMPDEFLPCRDAALHAIFRFLRTERDERVVCRVMDQINWDDDGPLRAYVTKALSDDSPNVRRRAAGAIAAMQANQPVAELSRLWRAETRPWVRSTVAVALGNAGVGSVLGDFHAHIRTGDLVLGFASLTAVTKLYNPRSVPVLASVAGSSESPLQHFATTTLFEWNGVEGVDDALTTLALSEDDSVATSIISAISSKRSDALDLLRTIQRRADSELHPAAASAATRAIEVLTYPERFQTTTFGCGFVVDRGRRLPLTRHVEGDAFDFGVFVATPSEGHATLRCWDGPGYWNPAHLHSRVLSGEALRAMDVFEWDGETWYAAFTGDGECWLAAGQLAEAQDDVDEEEMSDDEALDDDAPELSTIEFDIATSELSSQAMNRALHIGFATLFDDDGKVTGVRLDASDASRDQIVRILDTRDIAEGEVAKHIDRWLVDNAGAWIGNPELGSRIQAAKVRSEVY